MSWKRLPGQVAEPVAVIADGIGVRDDRRHGNVHIASPLTGAGVSAVVLRRTGHAGSWGVLPVRRRLRPAVRAAGATVRTSR